MTNTSFSSGFGAGTNLGAVRTMRDRTEIMKKNQEMQQRQMQRQTLDTAIEAAAKQTSQLVKDLSPVIFTAEGEEKQNAIKSLKAGRGVIFDSTSELLNTAVSSGLISMDEAQLKSQQMAISGQEVDPKFAQQVAAEGDKATAQAKAEGALPSQLALERQRAITRGTPTSQSITTEDLNPNELRMGDPVNARAALKDYDRVNRQLRKAQNAFDAWKNAPGSGGITGSVAENIGGLIGQIPLMGEGMENGLNLMLTGGTTAENTRARTNAITLASDMLSEITGEESGRFTEAERDLAFRALRQLSPSASIPQIASAYRTFIETSVNAKSRASLKMGVPTRFETEESGNLSSEGRTDYVIHLMKRGFTEKQAIEAVKRRIRDEELEGAS